MPRFDQTGPSGTGPRTGWGQGRCRPRTDEATSGAGPYYDDEMGRRGRRRGGGQGLRRGWGSVMAKGSAEDSAGRGTAPSQEERSLRRRMEALQAELNRVKELLSKSSASDKQDDE